MATKANIAYRKAEAVKEIEKSFPDVFKGLPKTTDSDTRLMLQLEAIAAEVSGKSDAGRSADEPKAEAEVKESAQPKRKRKSKK